MQSSNDKGITKSLAKPQRVKRRPFWDCYYTAKEVATRDPLVSNDSAKETADSREDNDFDPNSDIDDAVEEDCQISP
jgi:hypothetical protein